MMTALLFIAKPIISCGLLYVYYHLFLRNKRFHRYNRFYLLSIVLFSCTIPFINIPVSLFHNGQQTTLVRTLTVLTAGSWEEPVTIYAHQNQWSKWLSVHNALCFTYIAGFFAGLIFLTRALAHIRGLKNKYPFETIEELKIYSTTEPGTPFSFFRSIFWNNKISLTGPPGQQILRHEMFHVQEKHSADILFMEIVCCVGWFNPFYHLIKKEMKAIHEFLADAYAVSANNRYDYAELLVLHAMNQKTPALIHPFFHNQIKRRINMITQSNIIRRSGYISRIMALPLLLLLVSAFAVKLRHQPTAQPAIHYANKTMTVVVDAGHGGIFAGTNTANGITEKDITLSIAKKIKELSGGYNVNIVLTRNNDMLVGNATNLKEDLENRVEIAKESNADLFLSIHVNTTPEKTTIRSGFDAYISGRNEHPRDRQFATAILSSLKDIYAVNDTIQQPQVGVLVLDKNTCTSICLECGYITNLTDATFITNKDNQEKIARKILEGIVSYGNAQTSVSTASAEINYNNIEGDTITPEELSKLNVDNIKSITADTTQTTGSVLLKNGSVKFFYVKDVNDYYATHSMDALKGSIAHVDMQDSLVAITFNKDTVPAAVNHERWNKTFTKVEQEPEYPGGQEGWKTYLFAHLKYPQAAIDKEIMGTVLLQFIVDQQGKVSDVKAISGPEALRAESIRIIKESGNWISAMQNGKKVKAYKRQPITYKLERQS